MQGCYRKLVFMKNIPNTNYKPFHFTTVYLHSVGKDAPKIRSFVQYSSIFLLFSD